MVWRMLHQPFFGQLLQHVRYAARLGVEPFADGIGAGPASIGDQSMDRLKVILLASGK